jgi:hypothetical protein
MRNTTTDIVRLCESWWDKLADATRLEQQTFIRRLLELLGWDQPIPFSPQPGAEQLGAVPYLLRAENQTTVAAYFLPPGTLEPPSTVMERGLDFCWATRTLCGETRSPGIHYVLVSDLHRTYLYDARTDELLAGTDDPRRFDAEIAPALKREAMDQGALDDLRRQPRSAVARRLREWSQRWTDTFVLRGRVSEETATLALDRLHVVRFLAEHDILRRTRWRLQKRFEDLIVLAENTPGRDSGCGARLVRLFHDMWLDWRIDLFAPMPELDAMLSRDDVAGPWLREAALLAQNKFTIPTILESFNHGDPAEKMRVRMVPEENEERDRYLAAQTLDTIDEARIEIDLAEEGYRAVFHWFDQVVALYDRLNLDFDHHARTAVPKTVELDLFEWSEIDARRPAACTDRLAHACAHGIGIYHADARQYRTARLLLTLHLISTYSQRHEAVDRLPSLGSVFMRRPAVMSAGRVMGVRRLSQQADTGGASEI